MRRHTADVQARRQDGGAGRALRHLGDPVGKFFPLKILAGILYFPVPGVEKKKKLPVPRVTEISTVHLFISNLTRAVWGLVQCVYTCSNKFRGAADEVKTDRKSPLLYYISYGYVFPHTNYHSKKSARALLKVNN